MVSSVKNRIKIERIPGTRLVRLIEDFWFYSVVLGRWCCIPKGFVYDEESVPVLRGTNPEAGAIHDYLCRYNSDPVVDKVTAASVYSEFQGYYNALETTQYYKNWELMNWYQKAWSKTRDYSNRVWDFLKRRVKTDAVVVAPGYFHKLPVMATEDEVLAAL